MLCGTVPPSDCRFIDNQVLHFLSALFLLSSFIDWRDVPICVVSGSFEQGVMGASVSHHIDEVQGQRSRTFFIWSTWHILALLACYHQFSLAKFLTKQNMLGIALSLCSYPYLPPRTFPYSLLSSSFINPVCLPHRSDPSLNPRKPHLYIPSTIGCISWAYLLNYIASSSLGWTSSTFLYTLCALSIQIVP